MARLVDRVLRLVDQESTRTTGRHIERLQELLGELAEVLRPTAWAGDASRCARP
ncbi:MAG: hypothetical protein U1F53_06615 [Burkholderiaceae bacterium]